MGWRVRARLRRSFGERRRSSLNVTQGLALKDSFATHRALVEGQRGHDIGLTTICAYPVPTNGLDLVAATRRAVRDVEFHGLYKAFNFAASLPLRSAQGQAFIP